MPPILAARNAVALALALSVIPGAASAQTAAPSAIRPASAEVFEAIRPIYEYNRKAPLLAESFAKKDFPAYSREKVVFVGVQQIRVPAFLAIPKAGKSPFPVVILMHGLRDTKGSWFEEESWLYGTRVVDPLIAAGVAVLALDARHHGERGGEIGYRLPGEGNDFGDIVIQTVIEHRRAMDYLATQASLDTTRIGVLGISMGGAANLCRRDPEHALPDAHGPERWVLQRG